MSAEPVSGHRLWNRDRVPAPALGAAELCVGVRFGSLSAACSQQRRHLIQGASVVSKQKPSACRFFRLAAAGVLLRVVSAGAAEPEPAESSTTPAPAAAP